MLRRRRPLFRQCTPMPTVSKPLQPVEYSLDVHNAEVPSSWRPRICTNAPLQMLFHSKARDVGEPRWSWVKLPGKPNSSSRAATLSITACSECAGVTDEASSPSPTSIDIRLACSQPATQPAKPAAVKQHWRAAGRGSLHAESVLCAWAG